MNIIPTLALFLLLGTPCYSATVRPVTNTSKAGLAWPNGNSIDIKQFELTSKVSWYYTWAAEPINGTDLEFAPMLWGTKSVDDFALTIQKSLSDPNVKVVLGMNEPEQTGQSNLSPGAGADMWKLHLEPLRARGMRLGSPAPSSAQAGKQWIKDFLTACAGGCTFDFMAIHYYGINATEFIGYVQDMHDTFQKPIWVTEWACHNFADAKKQCSMSDVVSFMNVTQSWLDSAPFVERYSWFGAMKDMQGVNPDNALMDSKGTINALGRQYINATGGSGTAVIIGSPDSASSPSFESSYQVMGSLSTLTVICIFWELFL